MSNKQDPTCPFCGLTPCVGDRCPRWDDDDDWNDLLDDYEPYDADEDPWYDDDGHEHGGEG